MNSFSLLHSTIEFVGDIDRTKDDNYFSVRILLDSRAIATKKTNLYKKIYTMTEYKTGMKLPKDGKG